MTIIRAKKASGGGGNVDLSPYQRTAEKGQANGYASLGFDGKVPTGQLPAGGGGGGTVVGDWGGYIASTQAGPFACHGAGDYQAHYDSTSDKTFYSFYGVDYCLMVGSFHHGTRTIQGPVRATAAPVPSEDAHGVPTMTLDDNGRIHIIFGSHDTLPRYVQSVNPRDISNWTVTDLSVGRGTYHTMCWEPTTSALYVAYRTANNSSNGQTYHQQVYPSHEFGSLLRSLDRGVTWTELGAQGGSPIYISTVAYNAFQGHDYYAYGCDADGLGNVHLFWTIAGGFPHDGPRSDVFHVKYNVGSQTFVTMNGTDLGRTISGQSNLLLCRAAANARIVGRMRLRNSTKYPVILYHTEITENSALRAALRCVRWTGSAWADVDVGGRTHYDFHFPGLVEMANGDLIALGFGDRTDTNYVGHPLNDVPVYANVGADVVAYRSTDNGATWAFERQVIDAHKVRGQGISAVNIPRNAKPEMLAIACVSCISTPPNNLSAMRLNLYGITNNILRDAVLQEDPGTTTQDFIPFSIIPNGSSAPSSGAWTLIDLNGKVPLNATAVKLRATLRGGGVSGPVNITVRVKNTTNNPGPLEFTMRGEWVDDNLFVGWCPITPSIQRPVADGAQLEWKWSGTGTLSQAGWGFAGVRFH